MSTFDLDGRPVDAPAGMTLAAALVAHGVRGLSRHPVSGAARGAFCGMGVCQECEVEVDGRPVRACLTPVVDGMHVVTGGRS